MLEGGELNHLSWCVARQPTTVGWPVCTGTATSVVLGVGRNRAGVTDPGTSLAWEYLEWGWHLTAWLSRQPVDSKPRWKQGLEVQKSDNPGLGGAFVQGMLQDLLWGELTQSFTLSSDGPRWLFLSPAGCGLQEGAVGGSSQLWRSGMGYGVDEVNAFALQEACREAPG